MKTKKILSLVLAAIMMLSMTTTSFAADISTDGGSQEVKVTYGMNEGFTVTIPTNFTIDESKKATANVSAFNVMIAHGKVLEVSVSGDDYNVTGSWELIDEAEAANMLTYTIGTSEGGNDITNGSIVLDVESGEAYDTTITETMYFTVIDELSKAGTYKDTLTFTVSVEDVSVEMVTVTMTADTFSDKNYCSTEISYTTPNGEIGTLSTTGEYDLPLGTVINFYLEMERGDTRPSGGIYLNNESMDYASDGGSASYSHTLTTNITIEPHNNYYNGGDIYITEQ